MRNIKLGSALALALAAQSAHAYAQTTDSTPIDAASSQTEANDSGVAEVIVTAERRAESLQRTPLAVNAVTGQALINAGVSQPQDLTRLVPALKLTTVGGGGTQVMVRGVGNFVGNAYSEPAVAVNFDGVYLARSGGPNGLFYDLDRVEVLKGPQGTLYGRNATAGAINIITRRPGDTFEVSGLAEVGDYDLRRGVLTVNVPIDEMAAFRISGTSTRRDGYLSDGYLDDEADGARAQLSLRPSDDLSILVSADYVHQGGMGQAAVFSPFLNPSDPYRGPTSPESNGVLTAVSNAITGGANPDLLPQFQRDGFVDLEATGVMSEIEYDFGPATLTLIPAFRRTENSYLHYTAGFPVSATEDSEDTSVELRLTSNDSNAPLRWLLGGYYFHEDLDFDLFANQGVAFNRTIPQLETTSYAAFGQLTLSISDALRATVGLRYTQEDKSQTGLNGGPPPPVPVGFPGPAEAFYALACAPYDAGTGTCFAPLDGDLSDNSVTYRAGLEWDVAEQSLLYASVATGFKAGGFYGSLAPNSYDPETLTAYTIGSKNRFFDNTLQFNFEAFYWEYEDKQVSHLGPILPGGFNLITENAGAANLQGFEVDLIWRPLPSDTFTLDVQYLDSEYEDFSYTQTTVTGPAQTACPTTAIVGQPAVVVDCTGNRLPHTPEWTVNLSYLHSFTLSNGGALDLFLGTRIETSYWVGEEYLPGERQDGVTTSDASLTYHAPVERYSFGVYVNNIEDEAIMGNAFAQPVVGSPVVVLRPPRTFGARLTFDF